MPVTRILHGAGNAATGDLDQLLALARHPAVDAFEADVWVHGDGLRAHHERPLGPLPILVGPRGLRRRSNTLQLETVLAATSEDTGIVIDLRSWLGDPAPDLARALADEAVHARIRVTCEDWRIADRVRAWLPGVRVGYSVRTEAQLRAYLAGRDAGRIPETAVAVRHTLLHSADEVAVLRDRARRVNAWTVDDADRALELASWGVDEITSNLLTVLNTL
ncbi:MAG: glycerophosphodiester phosphodiesterase [Dehalococcoidia bacterium]